MNTLLPLRLLVAPDKNDPTPLVLYHGRSCPDGFAAALAARLYYGDAVECLGLDHGDIKTVDDLPPLQGRAVYILDFSFDAPILKDIEQRAAKLVLLDHHKSAAEKLTGFACRCGVVHFDMGKSGARLAWSFFIRTLPCQTWLSMSKTAIFGPGNTPRVPRFWLRWIWSLLILSGGRRLLHSHVLSWKPLWPVGKPWMRSLPSWQQTLQKGRSPLPSMGSRG